ncbi:hypothetical protein BU23DRAFT_561070 [Bimuria novae-zelandiae CBS 107.79]|uniref:Uncharacterized protein n=1 Tax=Bimuria novae-zelandiae CBS 107.79 TaxID=1447943 RepID=A0A6A5UKP1_9PLEO|nr:hypothetical protein BU23DRAFT_561070 [Bimuria novae-zelandiae CBS 107.79]
MPPQRTSGRPNDSRNLTEAQKGAIVALRKLSNTEYAYIAGAMEEEEDRKETLKRVHKANKRACKLINNKRAPTSKKGGALRAGCKNPITLNKFFKYKDFYAKRVLKDVIFPYYEAVRANNPWLRYCAPKIKEKDIRFAPHFPNLPNLHLIKRCFSRLKGFLEDYKVKSALKQAKNDAVAFVQSV